MSYKIYLYDTDTDCIGSGTLSSAFIQTQLDAAAGADVEVHISSTGGSAFDAIAIYDLLKKYPGNVITYIDALAASAASAASIIAMAGRQVIMSKYALLMIHKPMVGTGGNADELLKDVQMLNVVQERLAQIYMDKSNLDGITVNSLINAVTWMTADQALDLGFIDMIEDYNTPITNSILIKNYTNNAPALYQRCINKILTINNNNMNIEHKELIDKNTSVLNKIMNFFKKVMNKQTITDKGALHHSGQLEEGAEVFQDEDMSAAAITDLYTCADGKQLDVKEGKVQKITPAANEDETEPTDDEEDEPSDKFKPASKPFNIQNRIEQLKARLHAQNALLTDARIALEEANSNLQKTRTQVKSEIKSTFIPESSKRSNKSNTEPAPFFAPQTEIAKNAVKKAIAS